jgi:hypothetical protein
MMLRTVSEIIDAAIVNTLLRLRTQEPKRIQVKTTGNKKALHQKNKNVRCSWMD